MAVSGEKHQEARDQVTREMWNEATENVSESQSLCVPVKRALLLHRTRPHALDRQCLNRESAFRQPFSGLSPVKALGELLLRTVYLFISFFAVFKL